MNKTNLTYIPSDEEKKETKKKEIGRNTHLFIDNIMNFI